MVCAKTMIRRYWSFYRLSTQ